MTAFHGEEREGAHGFSAQGMKTAEPQIPDDGETLLVQVELDPRSSTGIASGSEI